MGANTLGVSRHGEIPASGMATGGLRPAAMTIPRVRMKTSYEKIVRGVLRALVAAGALTAVSLFLYLRAFHEFKTYDDEGYVMLTQQGFNQGHALYDEIFTQYGPFSYIVRDVIYRVLPDSSVTHNANRLISLTFYLWTAVLLAVAAYRLTRSGLLAAIVFAASAVEAAEPLGAEPGHPQDLIVLLLACLLVAATLMDTSFMRPVLLGTLLAAISMTKINEGIYLSTALFVTTLFYCRNTTRATKRLWITASAAVILMPITLMRHHLFSPITWSIEHGVRDRPWIWFAAVQLVAALAWLLVSSSCETSERGKTFPWRPFAAWAAPAGVVALAVAFYCIVRGSSLHGLVDGILLRPQSLPAVFSLPVRSLHSYHAIFAMLIFSLATLCLSYPECGVSTSFRYTLWVVASWLRTGM